MNPQTRHAELVANIRSWDFAYYVESKPVVTDLVYDSALRELQQIEQANPELRTVDSPTQRIGSDLVAGFEKKPHRVPMLSLDNIFEMGDLESKLDGLSAGAIEGRDIYTAEPKVDGMSLDLLYSNGILVQALTRGNGEVGDDVTVNARTVRSIPLRLQAGKGVVIPKEMNVRGEVFMTFNDFNLVNAMRKQRNQELLANPRNGASGAMKQLNPAECRARRLSFIPYHLPWVSDHGPEYQQDLAGWFSQFGFRSLRHGVEWQAFSDKTRLMEWIVEFGSGRLKLPYPTDGAVIKLNAISQRMKFAAGSKSVRWAYAYKYAPEVAETKLNSITIQIGRTGVLAPVAELEPVELAGTTVKRASLHNQEMIEKLDICVGDIVLVQKAGEIIPQVTGVSGKASDREKFVMPSRCPECGGPVVNAPTNDGDDEGVALCCANTRECPAQIRGRLEHWCSKEAMNIEDVGPTIVEMLVKYGCRTPAQLYHLTLEDLEAIPGFGSRRAANVIEAIKASKDNGLERVLVGLGIPGSGVGTSKKLARAFTSIQVLMSANSQELGKVAGMTKSKVEKFLGWCAGPAAGDVQNLIAAGVNVDSKTYNPGAAAGVFAGKSVVFTGTLKTLDRDAAKALVENNGGRSPGSVSKKTDYLVAGAEAGSKLDKAKANGVKILTEDEFLAMLGNEG